MSIEKHIDNLIREVMERGEFKNLKGEGKPLDLTLTSPHPRTCVWATLC